MKRIVSISLGSSNRDHQVVTHFAGEEVSIKRIGTDGNAVSYTHLDVYKRQMRSPAPTDLDKLSI